MVETLATASRAQASEGVRTTKNIPQTPSQLDTKTDPSDDWTKGTDAVERITGPLPHLHDCTQDPSGDMRSIEQVKLSERHGFEMSRMQKSIILATAAALTLLLLWPPFEYVAGRGYVTGRGFHSIFTPDDPRDTVNTGLLAEEILVTLIVGGLLYLVTAKAK